MTYFEDFYNICPTCGKDYPYVNVRQRIKVKDSKGNLVWSSRIVKQETCSAICQGEYEKKKTLYNKQFDPNDAVNVIQRKEKENNTKVLERLKEIRLDQKETQEYDTTRLGYMIKNDKSKHWKYNPH